MTDIPVNRVANNLVITQKDNSKYLGLYLPILTPSQFVSLPTTLENGSEGAPILAVSLMGGTPGGYGYFGLNLNLSTPNNPIYEQFVTCSPAATGAGLTSGSPLIIPEGTRDYVENDAGNSLAGFLYYDTSNHVPRIFLTGVGWRTIQNAP